ncbi:MAG: Flp/Fap pilin component [Thermacetogenium sp.]|nr:Flp/Fap pilin component [Thermacetogenium sp.]
MKNMLKKIVKDERGQTLSEYGLLIALIAVVCLVVLGVLGTSIRDKFTAVKDAIQNAQ